MGIREIMARARRAQIEHDKRIPVQLVFLDPAEEMARSELAEYEFPDDCSLENWNFYAERIAIRDSGAPETVGFAIWASDEERMAKFREETVA